MAMVMTRADLIQTLMSQLKTDPTVTRLLAKNLFAFMTQTLKNGDRIEVRDFGCFETQERLPRSGRNPRTGETVAVSARHIVRFKPGKLLRDRLQGC